MNKEITLPWTCGTGSKISYIIGSLLFPIGLFFLYKLITTSLDPFSIIYLVIGMYGTAIGIITPLWYIGNNKDKLPTFKCKPKENKS